MDFRFSPEKDALLREQRGVGFLDVIDAIAERGVLLDIPHPDQVAYPGQRILVVDIDRYAYCVPYVIEGHAWFLKTLYPNRKFKYLIEGDTDG